jgi:hypothetical protein
MIVSCVFGPDNNFSVKNCYYALNFGGVFLCKQLGNLELLALKKMQDLCRADPS